VANISLPDFDQIFEQIGDPAPDWTWIADIDSPKNFVSSSVNKGGFFSYNPTTGVLNRNIENRKSQVQRDAFSGFLYRIEEISARYWQIDTEQRFYAGNRHTYPGYRDPGQITLTLFEDTNYSSWDMIVNWMDQIIDKDGNYGVPADYARNINIYAFDGINRTSPRLTLTYENCWPTNTGEQNYAYGNNGRVRWSVPFAVNGIVNKR